MKKNAKKKSLLFYSIMLLSILSVGILATLFGPNVKNSVLSMFKNTEEKNSDGSPLRSKTIKDNGDGTYTIALNVTGESEVDTQPNKKANVIIVMDTSGSMEDPADYSTTNINSRRTATGNTVGRFAQNGGYYWRLYYRTGSAGNYSYYPEGTGPEATKRHQNVWYPDIDNGNLSWVNWSNGTRYNFANNNARIDDTIPAVVNAIDTLLGQNTAEVDDMVEISLVAFGSRARYISPTNATGTWTKGSKDGTAGEALKDMVETGLIPYGSTNWDEALYYAQQLAANKNDGDDTYIIFFSDGEPTYHIGTSNGVNSHNHSGNSSGGGNNTTAADINAAYYEANQIHNKNYKLFGIYAYGSGTNGQTYMKNLTSYANYGDTAHAANNHSETVVGNYYFSADNEEAINNAFNQIASFISSNVGFSDVSISDGTTAAKTASSGQGATGSLLKVDTNSYKYYLSFPLNADGTSNSQYITEITKVAGTDNDYQLKSSNGNTYTVTRVPAYKTNSAGKVTTEEDTSIFKFEWKNNVANPLHQENPPVATYNTTKNSVDWDLSTLKDKVLLNGVTYEVTFDCYPSQVTLDIFADVKNGKIKLDTSNEDYDIKAYGDDSVLIEDYIVCNKETKECALMTNTDATLTYTDTRTDDGEQTAHYENPDPVPSSSIKSFAVSKEWENFGSTNGEARIDLNVDRDDSKKHYSVGLSGDNNWKDEIYASIGIMIVNGDTVTVKPGAEGHDYSFSEEQNISYKWELTSPTVRPMLINGVAKSLIKVDKPAGMTGNVYEETPGTNTPDTYEVNSNGKNTYYKIGDNYYVVAKGTATLTATNSRRSYLDVTKSVEGADAPAGSLFEYNMTITEGKGEKVYFSIQDENGNTVTNKEQYMIKDSNTVYVTGATAEISELKANGTDADPNITNVTVNELNHTITYNYGTSTYTVTYVERLSNGNYTYYTGYYYMNSGSTANIKLAADWNIRFTNLSSNTEYTITETNNVYKEDGVTPVTGFKLNKTEIKTSEVRDGADDTYTLVTEGTNRTVQSTMSEANLAYKVAFTNEYVLTHVDVKKVWDDNHNQDGKRTKDANGQDISLEFVLKQNGTIIDRVSHDGTGTTIDEDSDEEYWEYTFNNLNVYDTKGNKYTYTVEEVYNNSAYTTTSDGNATDGYVFTNTHTPETIDITVEKIWKDNNDQDGLRAAGANATITLYDGTTATNYKLETNTNNSTTFTGLPVYRDGEKIVYSVQETETSYITGTDGPGTYDYEITGNATDGFVVTNTHTPETIDIKVEKVWKDNEDQDGLRAAGANATITLYDGTTATDNVLTTNEDKDVTFTVDKYRKGSIGVPAQYSVKETETSYITGTDGPGTYAYEITGNVTDGFVVTNTHTPETIDITVEKVWEDNNDQDGLRAAGANATITLYDGTTATDNVLTTNEDKNVTFTVDKYRKGSIGVPAQYSVQETETSYITGIDGPGTYAYEITGNVTDGFVVTNTHTPETRQIKVVKVWSDNNDQDGLRRNGDAVASITLYADNAATENVLTTDDTETIHRTESATYTVDKYADGEEIVYSVQENTIDGYEASTPVKTTEGEVTVFTITNTHTPETRQIKVVKVWSDNNDQDGLRRNGDAIASITLYANNAATENVLTTDDTKEIHASEEATYTVDKYADGEEIVYSVKENTIDGYEASEPVKTTEGEITVFTITNTHTPETRQIKVVKVWSDNNDQDGLRRNGDAIASITLYANNTATENVLTTDDTETIHRTESATYTVDKYADGEEIVYSVQENTIDGYEASEPVKTTEGEVTVFTITNTHTPKTTDITVTKVWDDDNNHEGFRPDSVSIKLYANDKEVGTAEVKYKNDKNNESSWTYTFKDLDVYADGEEITYTIEEIKVDKYESEYDQENLTVTNKREVEPTEVKVTKVWDDNDNEEGFRPGSVTFNLYGVDKTTAQASITLSDNSAKDEAGNWTYTFTDLDKYADGQEINYTVEEVETDVITGEDSTGTYDYEITGDKENGFVITNTHTPEDTKVSVTKVWEDENNKEGFRPTSVQVQLKDENGNVGEPITLNASNSWKYEWTELQKYRDGNEIAYTVEEVKTDVITGTNGTGTYSIAVSGTQATGYTITNTHSSETRSITITKVWDDENNKEGFRPGSIDIELTSQTESETEAKLERVITLDGEKDDIELDKWVATLTGLPKYRNGEEITYSVSETREGNLAEEKGIYTISETGNMNAGFTITNTHEVTPTEVKVTKVWDDESNKEGFRPTSITLILHASDSSIEDQTATVTGNGDEWSYTFPNLLAYSNGQKVTYTVEEVKTDVITGTDSTGTYEVLPIQGNQYTGYTITNKHTPETTTSTVVKVWDDNSNQDKVRPATTELEFQLKANGENVGKPITLNDNGNNQWSYTVDNLPKYANKQLIEYTWTEDESSLPEGYELTSTTKSSDGLTVTLTNHRDTDKITINGKKVWDDSDNNDKVRPTDGIDVQLYANGSAVGEPIHVDSKDNNEWSFSFPDLEVNDANGAITYTVDEVNVPDGYTKVTTETNPTGVGNEANGYTITNKHTKETTSVKVEKVWDDDDNRDAIQPESITIELYANGTDKVGSKVLDGVKDENGEYDSWKAEFTGLDKLLNGNEITYTVKEVETGAINNDSKTGYAIKVTGDQETGYTITNTHEVETTEIKVTKVWDDDDNRDNIRPNEVTVNIYQDGSKTAYRSEKVTFEKDKSENTWYYTFTNLPKYKNVDGKKVEIVYSIDENAVTDYSGKVDNETYTITNSHTPVKTEISGYKVWKDSSNRDAKRPTTVTVKLYADDVFYESKEVTGSGDEWKYTFDQLPKYKNDNGTRKEVKYTVEEVNVPEGYTSTIDEKDPFIIYNTYEAETTKVSGEKTWNDDDNREALRPTSIKVILMADGEEADTKEVKANAEGKWLYSFDELPKYKNVEGKAQEIVYTISEIAPEGYAPSYDIKGNVTNIENVHEIERITIDGVKDWDDEDDIEGFRPEAITINLLADNEKIDSYEATAADGWKYSFEELPKYKNVDGEKVEIKYTLTEESVDGYTADIEGYEITNIHKVERVSFHITKVWDDDDNRDGIRPKSIVVTLNANGVAKQSVTLDGVKDDDEKEPWSYDFVNLPKHSDGKVITYTITEDKHEGYTSSITDIDNNTTEVIITNTHTPERTEVSGTKTWEGDEDHLDQRPKYITVKLYADGELIDTIVVRAEDEWKYIVENLYKYKGGVPIKYTIEEQAVEGYITNYDGFNIINTRDSSGDVVPEELPPHTGVDYKYLYEFIITGLSGLVLLYRKEY